MNFEWEEAKAAANLRKHKVTFAEASTVFEDDLPSPVAIPIIQSASIVSSLSECPPKTVFWRFRIRNEAEIFVSSAQGPRRGWKGKCMKKTKAASDELRPEYRREDFGEVVRGKYAQRCREASNIVVISPDVQKAFPNAQAVNDALRGLLELAQATGLAKRSTRTTRKRAAG